MNREKLLGMATSPDDREMLARAIDLMEMVQKNHRPLATDFYDPYRCAVITGMVSSVAELATQIDGGYPAAERSRVLIFPDYLEEVQSNLALAWLKVQGDFRFQKVNHRDYLGALLGLGLRRGKLGDILVGEDGAQLIVAQEVAGVIITGLTEVGRVNVTVTEINQADLVVPSQNYRQIKATVSSLRLDAVAAHGFGLSRSKMAAEIAAGKINLNWQTKLSPSAVVKAGDMISARGRGRVAVAKVGNKTKKGRTHIVLNRYQ